MTTIITKFSTTASAVPSSSDLVTGELAVNVVDKRLFTEDNSATVVELGTNPSSLTTGAITATTIDASGAVTANSSLNSSNAVLSGGTVNGIVIGGSSAQAITGTLITASTNFVGALTGNVTGNTTGTHTGGVVGDVTGNLTSSSGTTTIHDLVINGTVDFNAAELTDIADPVSAQSAATKNYVDTRFTNLIDGAPAALDTLNELAAAMNDDASFHTTITNSLANKLNLSGGTLSGALSLGTTNKITNLANGTASADAVNKGQLDLMLPLAGGTLTGNLDVGSNSVSSSHTPGSANDLTNKSYVDGILGSATSAAASAAAAATSESNASSSAASALSSQNAASTSATSAANSLDSFTDQYQGAQSSDPATDPDGDAQVAGNLYFNTTSNAMKVYSGSSWSAVAPTATSVTWSQVSDAPAYASESGKYLKSSGGALVWEVVADEIPSQTGQSGKYLTTNGSNLSWAEVQAGFQESKAYFFASF